MDVKTTLQSEYQYMARQLKLYSKQLANLLNVGLRIFPETNSAIT